MSTILTSRLDHNQFNAQGYLTLSLTTPVLATFQRTMALAFTFFRQPLEDKSFNSISPLCHGYRPFGSEYSVTSDRPDLAEYFLVSLSTSDLAKDTYSDAAMALHRSALECITIVNDITSTITRALTKSYASGNSRISEFPCDWDSDLQFIYYRPALHDRDLLQDAHEDGLYLTILKSTGPGLEIEAAGGAFHALQTNEEEMLVIPGEIATLMTGGAIRPLTHRVRRHAALQERLTLAYFALPNLEQPHIRPWIENAYNRGADILERAVHNRDQFLTQHYEK